METNSRSTSPPLCLKIQSMTITQFYSMTSHLCLKTHLTVMHHHSQNHSTTAELKQLKSARRYSEAKWREKAKLNDHKKTITAFEDYNMMKNRYNRCLESTKQHHYNSKIVDAGPNSKEVFSIMKSLLHENNHPPLSDHDSKQGLSNKFTSF